MKFNLALFLIFTISLFTACGNVNNADNAAVAENHTGAAKAEIKQITVEQARQAVESKDAQFIDVRTVEEYDGGHAPKTINFPLDTLEENLTKLDKDKPVYLICETGLRSMKGAKTLQEKDFKEIYNIDGGTSAWASAGLPIEK